MHLFSPRAEVAFPNGANSSDVLINGIHFNLTTLNYWNFTLYDNGTLSNGSNCYLTLPSFYPVMLSNGTFLNATSCYAPYFNVSQRGGLGVGFACLFAMSLMFTLWNLRKHGTLYLPQEKRFRAVGRRWQWYWMSFVAACGIISCISAVDVDRDYLPSLPLILEVFFWYLMMPGVLATVWEGVRHWGSWQERQLCDREPVSIPQTGVRAKKEFYMPLIFYLFAWMTFFMTIPRNWGPLEDQVDNTETDTITIPNATEPRLKAAGILAFLAWCATCYHLYHSIHYYKPKRRGPFGGLASFIHHIPLRFVLILPLLLTLIAYTAASAWIWDISPVRRGVNTGWLYGLGYAPVILILAVNEVSGIISPNEDQELLRQRTERGHAVDAELGIDRRARKPWWWRTTAGHTFGASPEARLRALTTEIGGGMATARGIGRGIELGNVPPRVPDEEGNPRESGASEASPPRYRDFGMDDEGGAGGTLTVPDPLRPAFSAVDSEASGSTAASLMNARPAQVKSMLDI